MSLIFYVFAVMATALFGDAFPDWFGDLGKSLFTLFQVMTLESWSMGIARPVMDVYPYAFLFFMPFVLISAFVILNFFVAIIVNGMTDAKEDDDAQKEAQKLKEAKENQASNEDLKAELKLLKEHIAKIEAMLDSQNNDKTKFRRLKNMIENEKVEELMLELEDATERAVSALEGEYSAIRAGRANPHILDRVEVEAYGGMSKLMVYHNDEGWTLDK